MSAVIARRILDRDPEITWADIDALARDYMRLHAQRTAEDHDIPAPPSDADKLRDAVRDALDPPENRQP